MSLVSPFWNTLYFCAAVEYSYNINCTIQYIDQFFRFCRAHCCARHTLTDAQSTLRATCVSKGRIHAILRVRYDTRCYFNVRSKADISQLNLPHGTDN